MAFDARRHHAGRADPSRLRGFVALCRPQASQIDAVGPTRAPHASKLKMCPERGFRKPANRFFFREPLRSRELAHCAESDAMQFGTMVGYLTIDESSDQPTTRAAASLQDL